MTEPQGDSTAASLLRLLEQLDLSTEDLAREAGVHRATAYRWIAGSTPVPRSVIRMLTFMVQYQDMIHG